MKNKNGLIPGGYVHTKIKSKTNDDSTNERIDIKRMTTP